MKFGCADEPLVVEMRFLGSDVPTLGYVMLIN